MQLTAFLFINFNKKTGFHFHNILKVLRSIVFTEILKQKQRCLEDTTTYQYKRKVTECQVNLCTFALKQVNFYCYLIQRTSKTLV